ncbi:hypothetical protein CI610_00148 [invertebrate metagenome]|uniref:Uncharacterized protein n=1 Tax=invertebrate metagenome TaxID=1711999 RepID=A0A2H9TCC3_9ZZZZ
MNFVCLLMIITMSQWCFSAVDEIILEFSVCKNAKSLTINGLQNLSIKAGLSENYSESQEAYTKDGFFHGSFTGLIIEISSDTALPEVSGEKCSFLNELAYILRKTSTYLRASVNLINGVAYVVEIELSEPNKLWRKPRLMQVDYDPSAVDYDPSVVVPVYEKKNYQFYTSVMFQQLLACVVLMTGEELLHEEFSIYFNDMNYDVEKNSGGHNMRQKDMFKYREISKMAFTSYFSEINYFNDIVLQKLELFPLLSLEIKYEENGYSQMKIHFDIENLDFSLPRQETIVWLDRERETLRKSYSALWKKNRNLCRRYRKEQSENQRYKENMLDFLGGVLGKKIQSDECSDMISDLRTELEKIMAQLIVLKEENNCLNKSVQSFKQYNAFLLKCREDISSLVVTEKNSCLPIKRGPLESVFNSMNGMKCEFREQACLSPLLNEQNLGYSVTGYGKPISNFNKTDGKSDAL